jgi:Zn-dependent alcohol dehydrogenase
VRSVAVGEQVLVGMNRHCGRCRECGRGRAHLCTGRDRQLAVRGRTADGGTRLRLDGAEVVPFIGIGSFAEYIVVGESMLVPVGGVPFTDALALLSCGVVTGFGAVRNVACVAPGDSVLVVGCGGVGLNVVQAAALAGAGRVIAADRVPAKLELARALGATDTISAEGDLGKAVDAVEPGGVDHAFDVTGAPGVVSAAMAATRPGGVTMLVGSPAAATVEVPTHLFFGDRALRGCVGGNGSPAEELPRLLGLVAAGRIDLEALVSERIELGDVNGALERQRSGEVARSLIVFDD